MKKNVESKCVFESRLKSFWIEAYIYIFSNSHIRNVVSTLPNVVKINVENNNVVLTLSNVVQFNVEKHNDVSSLLYVVNFNVDIHNVLSTLIWRCATSLRHINLKATLNRHWNVCWASLQINPLIVHCQF